MPDEHSDQHEHSDQAGQEPASPSQAGLVARARRRTVLLAMAVVTVVLVGAGVAFETGVVHPDEPDAASSPPIAHHSPSSSELPSVPEPTPTDGGLKVVDKGIGRTPGGYTYGIILKNTSHLVVRLGEVTIIPLDMHGDPVAQDYTDTDPVSVIMPGARFGIGDTFSSEYGVIRDVRMKISSISWWAEKNTVRRFEHMTVTQTNLDPEYSSEYAKVTLEVRSSYGHYHPDIPVAYVIFRDANGKIVGGGQMMNPLETPNGAAGTYVYRYLNYIIPQRSSASDTKAYIAM